MPLRPREAIMVRKRRRKQFRAAMEKIVFSQLSGTFRPSFAYSMPEQEFHFG